MHSRRYFLVNDTRYDNHHGCFAVVRNLHLGMGRRGWNCVGSLPVSSSRREVERHRKVIKTADLIVVNGEGTLHDNSRNTERLFDVCSHLVKSHPAVLVNTVWQNNDAARWKPLLEKFALIYVRDRRSLKQLRDIGIKSSYAPDMTFYDYPKFNHTSGSRFLITDSVLKSWNSKAWQFCRFKDNCDFITMFTGEVEFRRGFRDLEKVFKSNVYPKLWSYFGMNVPPRYRSVDCCIRKTDDLLSVFAEVKAIVVARYHALCFAIQQKIPFIAVTSNSHKTESLLEEIGMPVEDFLINPASLVGLEDRLLYSVKIFSEFTDNIDIFNEAAVDMIDALFDDVVSKY